MMEMKLRTLTPLFIGRGEELVSYNWYINVNGIQRDLCLENEAYILKKDLISILLNELNLRPRDIKKIFHNNENKILNLKEIEQKIKNYNIIEKEQILNKIEEYKVKLKAKNYERQRIESKGLELFSFIDKDNELFFYIPGSSIKGVLRTYVIFKLLLEINNLLGNRFEYLANGKIKNKLLELRRKKDKKSQLTNVINDLKSDEDVLFLEFIVKLIESFLSEKDLSFKVNLKDKRTTSFKISKESLEEIIKGNGVLKNKVSKFIKKNRLDNKYFNFLKSLENLSYKIEDYLKKYSWLYGFFKATNFIVRDSEFLDLKNFIVLEVKRKKENEEKQGIPNFILALDENKEVKFELIIKNHKKEFFEFLEKKIISNVKFPVMEDNTLKLEMGRFAGANFKSFLAFLMDYYPSTENFTCDNKKLGKIELIFK